MGEHPGFCDTADEHPVRSQIHILIHFEGDEGIHPLREIDQPIGRTEGLQSCKLIRIAAAVEPEPFKNSKGGFGGKTVQIHDPRLLDDVMGIVLFVDGDSDPVRHIRNLRDCIDDKAVIFAAVPACYNIQSVPDVAQGFQISLHLRALCLGGIGAAQFFSQCLKLFGTGVIQRRLDGDGVFGKGEVFALFKHAPHDLCRQRSPGAVFNKSNRAVLEVPFRQVMDKGFHIREDIRIVGGGRKNELSVAEGILYGLGHVTAGQVVDHDLGAALFGQFLSQQLHGGFGVAVDRSISCHNAMPTSFTGFLPLLQFYNNNIFLIFII